MRPPVTVCLRWCAYLQQASATSGAVQDPSGQTRREGRNELEFPRCFRTLVVKIEKTNSNSTRDFSKRINFTRVDLFVWSTLVVKIKKRTEHIFHIRRT